ncbi:hypothetical protein HY639_01165 [Candidatus Woesearchaeota archaeon]|nr:hypothetical protein [Candidatus Woesearchaeota archaeon]
MLDILLNGKPREMGRRHGESLRSAIRQTIDLYQELWKIPAGQLLDRVNGYATSLSALVPHILDEMQGIADGAALSLEQVIALNARTELLPRSVLECTSIGLGGELGQNWDWLNTFKGLPCMVELQPHGAPRIRAFIEPGMVGKIGLNDAGVAVCLNYLQTDQIKSEGFPIHVLLRRILGCTSCEEAISMLTFSPRAASAHYLLADDYLIISAEATPEAVYFYSGQQVLTHTNSYRSRNESCPRQTLVDSYLGKQRQNVSSDTIKRALALPGVQFPLAKPGEIETLHTILLQPRLKQMLVSDGAAGHAFTTYSFRNL